MKQPDSAGRHPLSTREYTAIRTLFGCVNAFAESAKELKRRSGEIENGYRDLRLLEALSDKLLTKFLETVPNKQLMAISKELRHTICEVKIRPVARSAHEDVAFVPQAALIRLVNRAVDLNCEFCSKCGQEARRCPLYRDVQACFPYEFDRNIKDECPLSGTAGLTEAPDDES